MPRTISAGEALGHRRMRPGCKDEVIAYLASSDVPASTRRRWFREWCLATSSKVHNEDLARCAPPRKPKEQQLQLLSE